MAKEKAWIVIVDAKIQFSSNGTYRVMVDGCELMESRYLGKTRTNEKGKLITWYNWAKRLRKKLGGIK